MTDLAPTLNGATRFAAFIDKQIEQNPIEAKILRKIIRACKNADDRITDVFDGDINTPVRTEREVFEQVMNLDVATLYTYSGAFITFVMGNDWDCLSDYSVRIEDILAPVNDYIDTYSD